MCLYRVNQKYLSSVAIKMQCATRCLLRGVMNYDSNWFKMVHNRLNSCLSCTGVERCESLLPKYGSRPAIVLDNIVCRRPTVRVPQLPIDYFVRQFSSTSVLSDDDVKRRIENISDELKEAMELLDDARSSAGTTYFTDDMTDAEAAVDGVVMQYEDLLQHLNEDQKKDVVRRIGLKMEELKAQVQMLQESLKS